jgi:hypothetical protein
VSVNFNQLEALLRRLVWSLTGTAQDARPAVTLGDSFSALERKCRWLIRERVTKAKLRQSLSEWVARAAEANDARNEILHSSWTGTEGQEALALRHTRTGDWKAGLISTERLTGVADEILSLVIEGVELWERIDPRFGYGPESA